MTRTDPFKIADPVYLYIPRNGKSQGDKWQWKWEPFYRIIAINAKDSYSIKHSITGNVLRVHGEHLKLASMDWPEYKEAEGRSTKYVVPNESGGSDSDSDVLRENTFVYSDSSINDVESFSDAEMSDTQNVATGLNSETEQSQPQAPGTGTITKKKRQKRVYIPTRSPIGTRSKSQRLTSQELQRNTSESSEQFALETDASLINPNPSKSMSPLQGQGQISPHEGKGQMSPNAGQGKTQVSEAQDDQSVLSRMKVK